MATLLIVDDEPNVVYSLKKALEKDDLHVVTADTAEAGIEAVRKHAPDAVILDVRLPDMSGLDAFSEMHRIDARIPIILITAYTTTETAIEAMKRGAYEYLLKPVEFDMLTDVVDRALEISRMSRVPAMFTNDEAHPEADHIVGRSTTIQEVYKAIGRVAPQDVTVLITGESGTGKEMVARALYHHSRRSKGPFLAINCAALTETILESELFGHERGSFTGADRRRIGKFEQVDGGTIFLDEIGDMSKSTQSKVLRLLQDSTFERVGSNETIHVDVRVIAATNKDLEAMVNEGDFREDLYYRLKVFTIEVPPLRERVDDLPILVEHFIKLFNRDLRKSIRAISPSAMRLLNDYAWPGNVRELQSAIKQAMVRGVGEVLTADSLPPSCGRDSGEVDPTQKAASFDDGAVARYTQGLLSIGENEIYRKVHAEVDQILLPIVLDHVDGNQAQASDVLGIARSTLRIRIKDLGLAFETRLKAETNRGD